MCINIYKTVKARSWNLLPILKYRIYLESSKLFLILGQSKGYTEIPPKQYGAVSNRIPALVNWYCAL